MATAQWGVGGLSRGGGSATLTSLEGHEHSYQTFPLAKRCANSTCRYKKHRRRPRLIPRLGSRNFLHVFYHAWNAYILAVVASLARRKGLRVVSSCTGDRAIPIPQTGEYQPTAHSSHSTFHSCSTKFSPRRSKVVNIVSL